MDAWYSFADCREEFFMPFNCLASLLVIILAVYSVMMNLFVCRMQIFELLVISFGMGS